MFSIIKSNNKNNKRGNGNEAYDSQVNEAGYEAGHEDGQNVKADNNSHGIMGMLAGASSYEDFKFVIQDVSSTQFGAVFTFEELLMHENVPFKFQSIIQLYLLKLTVPEMQIGQHILSIDEKDFAYRIYDQLKLKVKFCEPKKDGSYKVVQLHFKKFKDYQKNNWTDRHVLQDITLSNLALMGFKI